MHTLSHPSFFTLLIRPSRRRLILTLLLALPTTILIAWSCALWSPVRGEQLERAVSEQRAFWWSRSGIGYKYVDPKGTDWWGHLVIETEGDSIKVHQHFAGWPCYAVRSRARLHTRETWHEILAPSGPRWELPLSEILARGPSDREFPTFMRVQPNRRLPLIPIPLGLLLNTLFYALFLYPLLTLVRYLYLRHHPHPRGFDVTPL